MSIEQTKNRIERLRAFYSGLRVYAGLRAIGGPISPEPGGPASPEPEVINTDGIKKVFVGGKLGYTRKVTPHNEELIEVHIDKRTHRIRYVSEDEESVDLVIEPKDK